MKRLTGKLVRAARRRIARRHGLPTSSVQIYRGHEEKHGNRYGWRHTWEVVISGESQGLTLSWPNTRDFLEDTLDHHG